MVLGGGDGAVIDPAVRTKGLVPVAGKPMIEWVARALRAAESIGKIAVVLPQGTDTTAWAEQPDTIVASDGSFIDNALAGLSAFEHLAPVLALTGDIPALTAEAIDDFVERSLASGAELTYAIVAEQDMEEQFPGSRRTYVKVDGVNVTGGNMMLLSPDLVRRNRDLAQRLFDARKSPLQMARVLGGRFIFRYVVGTLRVEDVEAKMEELVGGPCAAIRTPHASIGADVDKPIDVVVVQRILYARYGG